MLKKLRPFVIYSDNFLNAMSILMPIGGMSLFPVVILREKYNSDDEFWNLRGQKTINHESIHFQQQLELGVLPFYFIYVIEYLLKLPFYGSKAYENISFEREAYENDEDLEYLDNRTRYCWLHKMLY